MFECLLSVRGRGQSSFCGLFRLILTRGLLQVRFFERRFWDEDAQAGNWGLTVVGKRDASRSGQTEKLGCRTVLQAPATLAGRSEAGRPCRVVLKYREGAGVSCVDPLLGGVYPLSKGVWLFAAEGCVWRVVTVRWHPQQHPLQRLMTQMLSTTLSKSKYSINVGSYRHQYHPPDIPYPSSCQKEYVALLVEEPVGSFSEHFPQTIYLLAAG